MNAFIECRVHRQAAAAHAGELSGKLLKAPGLRGGGTLKGHEPKPITSGRIHGSDERKGTTRRGGLGARPYGRLYACGPGLVRAGDIGAWKQGIVRRQAIKEEGTGMTAFALQ